MDDRKRTKITVVNEDYLVVAKNLNNLFVLVMANSKTPGGGVLTGARAQEEDVFRRTNLLKIIPSIKSEYPLDVDNKGIYCFDVDVLKDTEENNYIDIKPYKIAAFIIPALDTQMIIFHRLLWKMTIRIRTIFEAAKLYGHRNLVLGAFRCDIFQNDSHKVATIFKQVISQYSNYFDNIIFTCMSKDDEANPFKAFKFVLENKK